MRLDPRLLIFEHGVFKTANAVTLARGLLIAPILGLLMAGRTCPALALYVLAALTDLVDGWLARLKGQSSAFGAQLDATIDNLFSLGILGFLTLAYPDLVRREWLACVVLFGSPLAYLGVSWLITRRLLMFHVWSAKLGAVLLFSLWPAMALTGWDGWLRLATAIVGLSRLEQVILIVRGGRDLEAAHGLAPIARTQQG
jgi:phosphatidylglycerophosphate synthase